tara:strand:- start:741 stop:1154 length:414 start_codon:yes stop_codon:yes gene_type:complete
MKIYELKKKIDIRIYYEDTDAGGVVYHSKYLNFAERGRVEFLRSINIRQRILKEKYSIQFVVKSLKIEFINYCHLDDKIQLISKIIEINKAKILFSQSFFKNNNIIASILAKVCCVNNIGKVARMPKSLYDKIIIKG